MSAADRLNTGPRLPRHASRSAASNDGPDTQLDAADLAQLPPYAHSAECSEFLADDLQDRSAYMAGWRWGAVCGAFGVCTVVLLAIASGALAGWLQ